MLQTILRKLPVSIFGPSSSTDRGLATWNGTLGNRLFSNLWTISSAGKMKGFSSYSPINEPASAATVNLDLNSDNIHVVTLTQATTLTVSNATKGQRFAVKLIQNVTGGWLVTWFSGITWPSGVAPTITTTASKGDWYGFVCTGVDGYGNPVFDGFTLGQVY